MEGISEVIRDLLKNPSGILSRASTKHTSGAEQKVYHQRGHWPA